MVGRRGVSGGDSRGAVSVLGGVPGDRRTGVPGSKVGYMPQVRMGKGRERSGCCMGPIAMGKKCTLEPACKVHVLSNQN